MLLGVSISDIYSGPWSCNGYADIYVERQARTYFYGNCQWEIKGLPRGNMRRSEEKSRSIRKNREAQCIRESAAGQTVQMNLIKSILPMQVLPFASNL